MNGGLRMLWGAAMLGACIAFLPISSYVRAETAVMGSFHWTPQPQQSPAPKFIPVADYPLPTESPAQGGA